MTEMTSSCHLSHSHSLQEKKHNTKSKCTKVVSLLLLRSTYNILTTNHYTIIGYFPFVDSVKG